MPTEVCPPAAPFLTLDALLATDDPLEAEAACLVCGGDTFPIVPRSGATTVVCRGCGSSLEHLPATATDEEPLAPGRRLRSLA